MENTTRLRFAPSPTGHLHIGNARTAILNWIFARKTNGKFILRIEDTDIDRSSKSFEQSIFDDLHWLGLDWDEGPEISSEFGPYRQSERLHIYQKHLQILKNQEIVYPCFCQDVEVKKKRKDALARGDDPGYDRKCFKLSEKEKRALIESGQAPVWRFYVRPGVIKWNDLLKGKLIFEGESYGDFIVTRSDGSPTYNFAAAVDDISMKISHVIRGDDHVSNTPRQILIYEALEQKMPEFCHIPMILGPDRTRLSKRHGATSIDEFKSNGYLPNALINFLSLLSWSSESGDEILSIERLIQEFAFSRMSRSPAIFDIEKLNWMNGCYIRETEVEKLVEYAVPVLNKNNFDTDDRSKVENIMLLIRDSIERLSQIPDKARPFYQDAVQLADGQAIALSSKDSSQKIYWAFLRYLHNYDEINLDTFRTIMKLVQIETGIMGKDLWMPIRVALTGQLHGPDLPKAAVILGKDKCEQFIKSLIDH